MTLITDLLNFQYLGKRQRVCSLQRWSPGDSCECSKHSCLGRVLKGAVHFLAEVRRQRWPDAAALESRLEAAVPQGRQRLVCAADKQAPQEHLRAKNS